MTTSEILYAFPKIERDIEGLEKIYDDFREKGVQIKEMQERQEQGPPGLARRVPAPEVRPSQELVARATRAKGHAAQRGRPPSSTRPRTST